MLIKRIKTKVRPTANIPWGWAESENEIIIQLFNLEQSLIDSGIIHATFVTTSDDELTVTKELQFTSIENYVNYEKQWFDLSHDSGDFSNSTQYFIDNNITHTVSYIFEN